MLVELRNLASAAGSLRDHKVGGTSAEHRTVVGGASRTASGASAGTHSHPCHRSRLGNHHHRPLGQCRRPCRHVSSVRRTYIESVVRKRQERQKRGENLFFFSFWKAIVLWDLSLLDVVHCCDGFLRIIFVGISHEAKSSAATCISVFDDNLNTPKRSHVSRKAVTGKLREPPTLPVGPEVRLTASSTTPYSSNFCRRVPSSVCQARPLPTQTVSITPFEKGNKPD